MQASPTPTIDSAGLVTWTNPVTPPLTWAIVFFYDNAVVDQFDWASFTVTGVSTSFDAFAAGNPGGLRLGLAGLDINGNVTSVPVPSVGQLTKNQ
jgi:hypothetical protein